MSVTLPLVNILWPLHRILTCDNWQNGKGAWTVQPMWEKGLTAFGFEVLSYSRVALPATGEARIRFRYGQMNGRIVAPSEATADAKALGVKPYWDPTKDTVQIPNLRRKEIRIQAAIRPPVPITRGTINNNPDLVWRTVWWGQVEHQQDNDWAGAAIPSGDRTYICMDGLFRTSRWSLNRHAVYIDTPHFQSPSTCYGHPGYNSLDQYGIKRGNQAASTKTTDPTAIGGAKGDNAQNVTGFT